MEKHYNQNESGAWRRYGVRGADGDGRQENAGCRTADGDGKPGRNKPAVEQSRTYRFLRMATKWMDRYYLDPILGFVIPGGMGDFLTSLLALPFIYVAACKVRSLPLTLAVVFNIICDLAIGLIPFCIGDMLDVFNRSYLQNMRLIVGFVEGDRKIVAEVNGKAVGTAVFIVVFCVIIYYLASLAVKAAGWGADFVSYLVA